MEDSRSWRGGRDPYELLGVLTGASQQEIARAYRRAAHSAHPDTQPQDPQAATRFRALTDAYEMLSDPGRRADYDRKHPSPHHLPRGKYAGTDLTAPRGPAARPPYGQPLWAGPVHVQPPEAPPAEQGREDAPAVSAHHDPDVYLGSRPLRARSWPW